MNTLTIEIQKTTDNLFNVSETFSNDFETTSENKVFSTQDGAINFALNVLEAIH